MAGMGMAPKDGPKQGRYTSPLDEGAVEVSECSVGAVEAPVLPGFREYSVKTKRWWNTWIESPQTATFTGTDWQRLLMLAPLVESYYELMGSPRGRGNITNAMKLMAEIRQNESLLGATHLDRLRGRIKIDRASETSVPQEEEMATPEGVAIMADYRKSLGA